MKKEIYFQYQYETQTKIINGVRSIFIFFIQIIEIRTKRTFEFQNTLTSLADILYNINLILTKLSPYFCPANTNFSTTKKSSI